MKEEKYSSIAPIVFAWIKSMCKTLPCPECSQHATTILKRVNLQNIKSKQDFCILISNFHNVVNQSKKKPIVNSSIDNLNSMYNNENFIQSYNQFVSVYQENPGMKLQTDTFQRKLVSANFKKWLIANIKYFNP